MKNTISERDASSALRLLQSDERVERSSRPLRFLQALLHLLLLTNLPPHSVGTSQRSMLLCSSEHDVQRCHYESKSKCRCSSNGYIETGFAVVGARRSRGSMANESSRASGIRHEGPRLGQLPFPLAVHGRKVRQGRVVGAVGRTRQLPLLLHHSDTDRRAERAELNCTLSQVRPARQVHSQCQHYCRHRAVPVHSPARYGRPILGGASRAGAAGDHPPVHSVYFEAANRPQRQLPRSPLLASLSPPAKLPPSALPSRSTKSTGRKNSAQIGVAFS